MPDWILRGRELIVARWQAGETSGAIASAAGVVTATVDKWLRSVKAEGLAGLADRKVEYRIGNYVREAPIPTHLNSHDLLEIIRIGFHPGTTAIRCWQVVQMRRTVLQIHQMDKYPCIRGVTDRRAQNIQIRFE